MVPSCTPRDYPHQWPPSQIQALHTLNRQPRRDSLPAELTSREPGSSLPPPNHESATNPPAPCVAQYRYGASAQWIMMPIISCPQPTTAPVRAGEPKPLTKSHTTYHQRISRALDSRVRFTEEPILWAKSQGFLVRHVLTRGKVTGNLLLGILTAW